MAKKKTIHYSGEEKIEILKQEGLSDVFDLKMIARELDCMSKVSLDNLYRALNRIRKLKE